uniref:Peptidase S1 domain-containing protein n=1 Tax=Trichogramma kaykai TaxID=54128 RepID=A0ABD2VW95_9HYME
MKVLLALCAVAYLVTVSANNFSCKFRREAENSSRLHRVPRPVPLSSAHEASRLVQELVPELPCRLDSHLVRLGLLLRRLDHKPALPAHRGSLHLRNSEQWQQTDVVVGTNLVGQANATIYQVDRFIIHGDFISLDSSRWDRGINDIALVRVTKDIVYNEYVQPIRLAAKDHKLHEGSIVTITGWGKLSNTYEGSSKSLQMISRKVSNFRECKKQWMYMHEIPLDDGILCTVDILPTDQGGICKSAGRRERHTGGHRHDKRRLRPDAHRARGLHQGVALRRLDRGLSEARRGQKLDTRRQLTRRATHVRDRG